MSSEIQALISSLGRLPGFGNRSAARAALGLLADRDGRLLPLIASLQKVADNVAKCPVCGNFDTRSPCHICADPSRDGKTLCIVEDMSALWALERGGFYTGKYHLTGGVLSAISGVEPENLNLARLPDRVREEAVAEVVLALPATIDAKITSHYIVNLLRETGVRITELAHGVPIGGELDYLDSGTIEEALRGRRDV